MLTTSPTNRIVFRACWNTEANEVTIVEDRWAGICGPDGTYPAATLPEAEAALARRGFTVCGWHRAEEAGYVDETNLWTDLEER